MGLITSEVDGIEHRADSRNESRLVIEVETNVVGGFSVGGQYVGLDYPKNGAPPRTEKRQVVIYESQWPAVQAMVRTDAHTAALERSRAKNAAALERELKAARNAKDRERIQNEHEDITYTELAKEPGCEYGIPPLLSARVIKRDVPPPPTQANLLANQHGDLAAALRAMVEEMRGGRRGRESAAG